MAKTVKIENLGEAIAQELTLYSEEVTDRVRTASREAMADLVKRTKATAPVGARGSFRKHIASKEVTEKRGAVTQVWYVKPPDHRLTHLLVYGHATRNGGRTKADPFLENALGAVLPDYEKAVEEAVKND